ARLQPLFPTVHILGRQFGRSAQVSQGFAGIGAFVAQIHGSILIQTDKTRGPERGLAQAELRLGKSKSPAFECCFEASGRAKGRKSTGRYRDAPLGVAGDPNVGSSSDFEFLSRRPRKPDLAFGAGG